MGWIILGALIVGGVLGVCADRIIKIARSS
jgi:hypothetical protein